MDAGQPAALQFGAREGEIAAVAEGRGAQRMQVGPGMRQFHRVPRQPFIECGGELHVALQHHHGSIDDPALLAAYQVAVGVAPKPRTL